MVIHDHKKVNVVLPYQLGPGNYFGELAILFNCNRTATVRTTNYCNFARIEKSYFLNSHEKFIEQLKYKSFDYNDGLK